MESAFLAIQDNPERRQAFYSPRFQQVVHLAKVYERTIIQYTYTDTEVQILAAVDARTDWQGQNPTT